MTAPTCAALLLYSTVAFADVVPPPPKCPAGHRGVTGHRGPYCEPPPPKGGCPAGSFWTSTSPTDAWCNGTYRYCEGKEEAKDPHCKKTALCVEQLERICGFRTACEGQKYIEERVHGSCGDGGRCAAPSKCVTRLRWVDEKKSGERSSPTPFRLALVPLFVGALALALRLSRRSMMRKPKP
jgi:hypothetical protein